MSNKNTSSDIWAAWVCLVSALVVTAAVVAAAWHHDLLSAALGAVLAVAILLVGALGFWCEGYKTCERERSAASRESK